MLTVPHLRQAYGLAVLALVLLTACGGDSGPPDEGNNPPAGSVTKNIGPGGGTIATAEGGISLVFPAGALAAATDITIEPATNTAPGGIGQSYKISPAGLAIAQPVSITLGVDAAQMGDAQIEELGVAFRNKAGDWFTEVSSTAQAASARGGSASGRVARSMAGDAVQVSVSDVMVTETSVVTYWRVMPRHPRVSTNQQVTLTVEACFQETENTSYWNEDGVVITSRRRTRTCGASVRDGTWSVASLTGQTGSAEVGTATPQTPTSVATYKAPLRHPPGGGVMVTAALYWQEQNVTNRIPILVLVDQSTEWTGTVNWTMNGRDEVNVHNDAPYIDITTVETRESQGEIQLHALPGRVSPAAAILDPSSIIATDHFKRVKTTITKGAGCTTTEVVTTDVSGNHSEFPTGMATGGGDVAILFLEGNEYALGFYSVQWEGTGTYTIQSTTECAGDDDPLPGLPITTEITMTLGPEMSGGFGTPDGMYHTQLNPATPNILEGSANWIDGVNPWATAKVTWAITRP